MSELDLDLKKQFTPLAEGRRIVETFAYEQLALALMDYPDAFLAGGYLRDRLLGLKPKDIDIFTFQPLLEGRTPQSFNSVNSAGGGEARVVCTESIIGGYPASEFDPLLGGNLQPDPYPVQIIHLNPAGTHAPTRETAVLQFVFGIMQIVFDIDTDQVLGTSAFSLDAQRRTFTVCRCNGNADAFFAMKKFQMLQPKFEGWTLMVPRMWEVDFTGHKHEQPIDFTVVD